MPRGDCDEGGGEPSGRPGVPAGLGCESGDSSSGDCGGTWPFWCAFMIFLYLLRRFWNQIFTWGRRIKRRQ